MHRGSFISLAQGGRVAFEQLLIAAAGWNDVRTRRGQRHADRRAGLLVFGADLRSRLAWDAALDGLGIHRSALMPNDDILQHLEVINDELDLLIINHKCPNQLAKIAYRLNIPVVNAGSPEGDPARAAAEALYIFSAQKNLRKTKMLIFSPDNPLLRSWADIAETMGIHIVQMTTKLQMLPPELLGERGAGRVEALDITQLHEKELKDYTDTADVVRLSSSAQFLGVPAKAFCYFGTDAACERLIAPVAAAITERALNA